MPIRVTRGKKDDNVKAIAKAMEAYLEDHRDAKVALYRHNSVSIRIRVIDPTFRSMSKSERHALVWQYLEKLPEEVGEDISMLVVLAPGEEKRSIGNLEFIDPSPSAIP